MNILAAVGQWLSPCLKSLRARILLFFAFFLCIAWGIAALGAWHEARDAIDEFFDTQQMLFAKHLATLPLGSLTGALPPTRAMLPDAGKRQRGKLEDEALSFAIFTPDGKAVLTDGQKGKRIPFAVKTMGFRNMPLAGGDDDWRILWMTSLDGRHVIAVGQELDFRDDMAFDMLEEQMFPWLVVAPVLLLGLLVLLTRELAPLHRIARNLGARHPDEATPLATDGVPTEVLPMVQALNGFFLRLKAMLIREREFVSDAAHELRTPLAGLHVQAQVASQPGIDWDARETALGFLRQGVDRCARLVEQLLALSRLEGQYGSTEAGLPQLSGIIRGNVEWERELEVLLDEYKPRLDEKRISLNCLIASMGIKVAGYPSLVGTLLRNVLDNAARYTPAGGDIQICLDGGRLSVENDCRAIAQEHRSRLGERFFRPPGQEATGSGLGISIMRRIAEIHGFRLALKVFDRPDGAPFPQRFRVVISWLF